VRYRTIVTVRALLAIASVLQCVAAIAADASPPAAADAGAAQKFDVHEYRVLGNTVLSNRQIEGVLYPLLGDGKTFSEVQDARAALETAYHSLGFATVFVDIPPQEVKDGIVRLRVAEGRLRMRTITGARYFSEGKILEALPATQPGTVPNLGVLQQQLNAVNTQTADRSVVPVLKAGPEPGTMDLALKVDDHLPLHGSVDLNNQYTPDTDSLRVTFSLSYDNLFNELDSLAAQYTMTPQKTGQVGVFNTSYTFRPLGPGIKPSFSFTDSKSNVATIGTLGVLGDGQVIGARTSFPLVQLPGDVQSLTLGLDYKHFRNTINLDSSGAQSSSGSLIEPISYVNASLAYLGAWQRAAQSGAVLQTGSFGITVNAGPRGLANETENFDNTRFQARGNYAYFHSDAAFTTRLPWAFELTLKGSGQATQDPLVVYEQDAVTGANGVRGYLEAEVLADTAVRGTIQLQSPPLSTRKFLFGDAFLFYDAGRAHTVEALSGEPDHTTLRSWGAGLDLLPGHSVTGVLTIADPLLPGPRTKAHEPRVLFDVKGSF
jgi:hemolysin activation/secretion protein